MSDLICPYCGHEHFLDEYELEEINHHECSNCEKVFAFTVINEPTFESSKAECLNGGKHTWRKTKTIPIKATRMTCIYCREHRQLTNEERLKL